MTRQRADVEVMVRAWLEEGVTSMPDRVINGVIDQLPLTRQRRRHRMGIGTLGRLTPVILGAAAVLLAVAIGAALFIPPDVGDEAAPEWHLFPSQATELEAGSYLIGDPFPVRIGLTVPEGWETGGLRSTIAAVGSAGVGLDFTVVEAVYADPCHLEAGLVDPPVGPTVDDLASALAALPGVNASVPTDTVVGTYPAVTLTLNGPRSVGACTVPDGGPKFRIWGAPEWHWLDPNVRDRLWILEIAGTRLVISALEHPDASPQELAAINGVIASIEFEPTRGTIAPDGSPTPTASLPPLPSSGPIAPAEYEFAVRLHRYTEDGTAVPLARPSRGIVEVPVDWSATGTGIQKDGPAGPALSVGTVARVYIDPCRWETSGFGLVDPALMRSMDGLANALSIWERPGAFDEPPLFAPTATEPIDVPRYSQLGRYVELTIPDDVVMADCDRGEYRIWEDLDGRARLARGPGEEIRIWVVDYEPGLLVVDASVLPQTSAADRRELEQLLPTLWVFPLDEPR
jgi:hypothetical protein